LRTFIFLFFFIVFPHEVKVLTTSGGLIKPAAIPLDITLKYIFQVPCHFSWLLKLPIFPGRYVIDIEKLEKRTATIPLKVYYKIVLHFTVL